MIVPDVSRIEGVNLALRLVAPDDAAYIHGLRTDPRYNAHLSAVAGDVADQRAWIESYKDRESQGTEFYYIIERLSDRRSCGVVRLYDIDRESFTWGSWILDENKPFKAALESAILSFGVGFNCLNLSKTLVDVRIENDHALSFYRRLGMTEVNRDEQDIYFEYTQQRFATDLPLHRRVLKWPEAR